MSEWRVLLLGGTTATGKSTSGALVAQRVGIACISADSVWKVLMAATTPETHPGFHYFEPAPEVMAKGAEHLMQLHVAAAQAMTPAIDAFLDWELHERNRFVFQGAWITPRWPRASTASDEVRAVILDEEKADDIMASIPKRSRRAQPDARQIVVGDAAWRYGQLAPRASN